MLIILVYSMYLPNAVALLCTERYMFWGYISGMLLLVLIVTAVS